VVTLTKHVEDGGCNDLVISEGRHFALTEWQRDTPIAHDKRRYHSQEALAAQEAVGFQVRIPHPTSQRRSLRWDRAARN
jgi:hypothetical protein